MRINRILFLALMSSSLFITKGYGQTVTIDGELRSRGEIRDGFQSPLYKGADAGTGGFLRTKLGATYDDGKLSAKIQFINTNVSGQTPVTGATNGGTGTTVGVSEAWLAYSFAPEFSAAFGRQILSFDDGRLFSGNDFAATPSYHDLLLLKYKSKGGFQAQAGAAFSHNNDNTYMSDQAYKVANNYRSMYLLWLGQKVEKVNISAIFVNDNYNQNSTNNLDPKMQSRYTTGLNFDMNEADMPLFFHAAGYLQFGKNPQGSKLSSYYINGKVGYKFTPVISANIGTDIFSGSSYNDILKGKDNHFNKLYGANHYFYGYMEYWTNVPNQGLWQWYVGVTGNINDKCNVSLNYNKFSTMKDYGRLDPADPDSEYKKARNIGGELDLIGRYSYSKSFLIEGGVSTYFKNKNVTLYKTPAGNPDTNGRIQSTPLWAYIMLTFRPTFLSTKVNVDK